MTVDGASSEPLADDECVVRLTWYPQDIDDEGSLRPEALRREDLSGNAGKGVSVDRKHLLIEAGVREKAAIQQPKMPKDRVTAHLCPADVGQIHAATETVKKAVENKEIEEKQKLFQVMSSPLEKNPAHALIASTRTRTKSQINEARLKLIKLFCGPQTFDQYFKI